MQAGPLFYMVYLSYTKSMEFSPFIFLIAYLIGVIILVLLALINIYHIIRFGFLRAPSLVATFVFVILIVGIVLATLQILNHIDWQQPMEITIPFINNNEGFE